MKVLQSCSALFLLILIISFSGCDKNESVTAHHLNFISRVPVNVPEASGLAVFNSEMYLTVSDSLSKVYLIGLDGKLIRSLSFTGENLEGVTYDPALAIIFVVEEKDNSIIKLDTSGAELGRMFIPLENKDPKHGLEGITFNPNTGSLYVVSEMDPAYLFEIATDGTILAKHELSFAEDYSSVFYEPIENALWILSEDSQSLTKTTFEGNPLTTYQTGIQNGEGVIVDIKGSRVYIITDSSSSFCTLSF